MTFGGMGVRLKTFCNITREATVLCHSADSRVLRGALLLWRIRTFTVLATNLHGGLSWCKEWRYGWERTWNFLT
jgi:hypothetical protein